MLDQIVAHLRWLHIRGSRQHRIKAAIFGNQLGRGLGADARDAGDVVRTVAHQRQHITHQFGADTEFLDDFFAPNALVLHRVEHVDTITDQLHQILVG